jgi:hypothetical protein
MLCLSKEKYHEKAYEKHGLTLKLEISIDHILKKKSNKFVNLHIFFVRTTVGLPYGPTYY